MPADEFRRAALAQLRNSKATLERRLAHRVSLLAWPFGLEDKTLQAMAAECGYEAAFSLGNRSVTQDDPIHALPRHLMVDSVDAHALEARLLAAFNTGPGR